MLPPNLTNSSLFKILDQNLIDYQFSGESLTQLGNVHWHSSLSEADSILFYHLPPGKKDWEEFVARMKTCRYGLLIVDSWPEGHALFPRSLKIKADQSLNLQKALLDYFYPIQEGKKIVGVTGTNGKTTTTHLAYQIAQRRGRRVACLGTLGLIATHGQYERESELTTPGLIELRRLFHQIFDNHDLIFMEVSSHALECQRLYGLELEAAGWTNFGIDHLDFHKTLDDYFSSKLKIVDLTRSMIIARGDELLLARLRRDAKGRTRYTVAESLPQAEVELLPLAMQSEFNVSNLELALALTGALGIVLSHSEKIELFSNIELPEGRMQVISSDKKLVVLDYAHTPDAMEAVCKNARKTFGKKKLFILFGCGGDRDSRKRPLMGQIAARHADEVILTSDNPRSEKPADIIADIAEGIASGSTPYKIVVARDEAIHYALERMDADSVLFILGKGHEKYQIIGNQKFPFSDRTVVEKYINDSHSTESFVTLEFLQKNGLLQKSYGPQLTAALRFSTDTRVIQEENAFLALNGEKFLGIDFVEVAIAKGCQFIVCEEEKRESKPKMAQISQQNPKVFFLVVESAQSFLEELAKKLIVYWNKKVIGITGSNGKTTVKEMMRVLLTEAFPQKVLFTDKNYNNHIGVPRTILNLNHQHEILILEVGTNHPGEISHLCQIAHPSAGIITSIGDSHLEFFYNRENVFLEKRVLFDSALINSKGEGVFLISGEDDFLLSLALEHKERSRIIVYFAKEKLVLLKDKLLKSAPFLNLATYTFQDGLLQIEYSGQKYAMKNEELIGQHNVRNMVSAFLLCRELYPEQADVFIQACQKFVMGANRSQFLQLAGKTYFLDAYNANPSSMRASLEGFCDYLGKNKIDLKKACFILGDMNELGEAMAEGHRGIGQYLKSQCPGIVVFIGKNRQFYLEGLGNSGASNKSLAFADKNSFLQTSWSELKEKYSHFFIKGSRSMALETLLK